jgi:hypothetical protein
LLEVPIEEEPERPAFSFFAWRFSFSGLLAAVFELFELLRGAAGGLTDADKIPCRGPTFLAWGSKA